MITIKESKEKLLKGTVLHQIGNILICVFIILLIPAVMSGVYQAIVNTNKKPEVFQFKQQLVVYEKTGQIQSISNDLHDKIEVDNNVTVYAIEKEVDGVNGKTNYYATIVANIGNFNSYKQKRFWQRQITPKGYEYFNKSVLKNGEVYLHDITLDENFYNGQTLIDCDYNGTRALYGLHVTSGDDDNQNYFIAVGFKFIEPLEQSRYFIYRTKFAAKEIAEIIKN